MHQHTYGVILLIMSVVKPNLLFIFCFFFFGYFVDAININYVFSFRYFYWNNILYKHQLHVWHNWNVMDDKNILRVHTRKFVHNGHRSRWVKETTHISTFFFTITVLTSFEINPVQRERALCRKFHIDRILELAEFLVVSHCDTWA